MIPIVVQTLIVTSAPGPSALVLRPLEDSVSDGKYRVVPIWVGVAEATQLSIALEHTKMTRPMTHDLFLDAITNLDARIDHVLINDVQGAMFFSKLFSRSMAGSSSLMPAQATPCLWRCGKMLPCSSKNPFSNARPIPTSFATKRGCP